MGRSPCSPLEMALGKDVNCRMVGPLDRHAFRHRIPEGTPREASDQTILAAASLDRVARQRCQVHRGQEPVVFKYLGQLLATWVVHDLDHIAQVARTMAKVYREATGPWSAYLSILRDREQ